MAVLTWLLASIAWFAPFTITPGMTKAQMDAILVPTGRFIAGGGIPGGYYIVDYRGGVSITYQKLRVASVSRNGLQLVPVNLFLQFAGNDIMRWDITGRIDFPPAPIMCR